MEPDRNWKTVFKDWLLQTRMARYPLLTIAIILALLAALWIMDPQFVRFLGTGSGQTIDEQIGTGEGDLNP